MHFYIEACAAEHQDGRKAMHGENVLYHQPLSNVIELQKLNGYAVPATQHLVALLKERTWQMLRYTLQDKWEDQNKLVHA